MSTREPNAAIPWLALSSAALAWALSSTAGAQQSRCALTHTAVAHGELWRLWTGHLVHFGSAHLRGDLLAFAVWAVLLERESRSALWRILLIAAPLSSLAILLSAAELGEYRGLSGLDCSLVVALICRRGLATERLRGVGLLCLAGFAAKCGYELYAGKAVLAPDLGEGVKLLPLAHVLGAAFGLLLAGLRPHRTSVAPRPEQARSDARPPQARLGLTAVVSSDSPRELRLFGSFARYAARASAPCPLRARDTYIQPPQIFP